MNRIGKQIIFGAKKGRYLTAAFCLTGVLFLSGCGRSRDVFSVGLADTESEVMVSETEGASEAETAGTDSSSEVGSDTQAAQIFVYMCGEVKYAGVYTLDSGSRICDAVEAAGGFTEDAAVSYWNLAENLYDGEMIYVPTEEEAAAREDAAGVSSEGDSSDSSREGGAYDAQGRLNINRATVEQLQELSGIGEQKAQAIVSYRQEHGNFTETAGITQVSGIGESTYNSIKDRITVD